ncbi:hypothetical protein U9M48_007895 [Paspalum notatum var. saurae]|uniref:Uncharacterized protein n=1 Tax=Paspalum notatum var. saurae TaxID=547442 RepID=A0AAQ3SMZ8_PASNO
MSSSLPTSLRFFSNSCRISSSFCRCDDGGRRGAGAPAVELQVGEAVQHVGAGDVEALLPRLQPLLDGGPLQRPRAEQVPVPLVLVLLRDVAQDLPRLCKHPWRCVQQVIDATASPCGGCGRRLVLRKESTQMSWNSISFSKRQVMARATSGDVGDPNTFTGIFSGRRSADHPSYENDTCANLNG